MLFIIILSNIFIYAYANCEAYSYGKDVHIMSTHYYHTNHVCNTSICNNLCPQGLCVRHNLILDSQYASSLMTQQVFRATEI